MFDGHAIFLQDAVLNWGSLCARAVRVIVLSHEGIGTASADEGHALHPAPSTPSLELLSMRHTRTGDGLTVTGLVRNRGDAGTAPIMAVVFVFDRDGGFVASGRAPLEFGSVAPGDESPFKVTIPDVTDVGRYRVSFRTPVGIVPHVDRRATLQVSN